MAEEGFEFKGWYEDGKKISDDAKFVPQKVNGLNVAASYWARFECATYTIHYELNGGTNAASNPVSYTFGTGVASFANPTRGGYDFAGWYSEAELANKVTSLSTQKVGNVTLYAKWVIKSYSVTYLPGVADDAANMPDTQTKPYGETLVLSSNVPTSGHYTFDHWNTSASGSGKKYAPGSNYKAAGAEGTYGVCRKRYKVARRVAFRPQRVLDISE